MFLWLNALQQERSRTLGPASMDDDAAWRKVAKLGARQTGRPFLTPKLAHLVTLWRHSLLMPAQKTGKPRAHTTRNTDKRNCQKHLSHRSNRIAIEMQPDEVQEWINQQSAGLRDKLCRTMSAIFCHAQKYGLIPRTPEANPCSGSAPPVKRATRRWRSSPNRRKQSSTSLKTRWFARW